MMRSLILVAILVATGTQGKIIKRIPIVRDNRIINGVDASPGEFPSQLSLQRPTSHSCGASILNENWALTAAHCVDGSSTSSITLYAGSIYLSGGGTRHYVSQIIVHESYNEYDSWKNDIAVIKVSNPFQIDGVNVKPISLPAQGQNPADGALATVIGWGRIEEDGPIPDTLQKVDIAIVNQDECNSVYEIIGYPIYDGQICAAVPDEVKGSCNGDSGGPLFVDGTLVGLVSWANGCARIGYPTVYTRVSAYRDWIRQNTGV
ncbi:trypsin-1-like [Periplaneta americana]|uniref:trypsin-1-like n=1 Tax=Periplaneta americana TaxID=6978 RepID=UPI0037E7D991